MHDPEIVISGPAGTGKSRACLEKMHTAARSNKRFRGLIIRKTRESLSESALFTFETHVVGGLHPMVVDGPQRRFRQVYRYPNGARIVVGGMDKPSKIMSTEFDMIYVQEATEVDEVDWLMLTTRLRNHAISYQQIIADCNPDTPTHWLYLRCQTDHTKLLQSRHEDNPVLHDGHDWTTDGKVYLELLDRLGHIDPNTGERVGAEYDRLRLGKWVQASGLVYDVWSDGPADGNVTEAAEYVPDAGPVFWSCDDGYAGSRDDKTGYFTANSHPRVFLLIQERADGRICVFREDYRVKTEADPHIADIFCLPLSLDDVRERFSISAERTGSDLIRDIRQARDKAPDLFYPEPEYIAVDSAAATLVGMLHNRGFYTRKKPVSVEESIKNFRRMLAPDSNGWRRVTVHPRCKHLKLEFASYRIDPQTGKPIAEFDHGPSAGRYFAWTKRLED